MAHAPWRTRGVHIAHPNVPQRSNVGSFGQGDGDASSSSAAVGFALGVETAGYGCEVASLKSTLSFRVVMSSLAPPHPGTCSASGDSAAETRSPIAFVSVENRSI